MKVKELGLTKEDYASVITLIDVMSQRGAVQGQELSIIGALRSKYQHAVELLVKEENENDTASE